VPVDRERADMKALLGLSGMGRDRLVALIDQAAEFRQLVESGGELPVPLGGRSVGLLFFEPSTRTRVSFELAAGRLGARVVTHVPEVSSQAKGETATDTALTLTAMGIDLLVVRHHQAGVPAAIHEATGLPVVNAGDGANEHPTQVLADLAALSAHFGRVEGLDVALVGDIVHSRVAGSLIPGLEAMGASVTMVGPGAMLSDRWALPRSDDLDAVIAHVDVVYLLRVQRERGAVSSEDYPLRFQVTPERLAMMRPGAVVMHPGPMNRGVEISDEAADGASSLILEQVRHGVFARMAVLADMAGGGW
jgi:aspartate carbamoyltransferase catalytic subunit